MHSAPATLCAARDCSCSQSVHEVLTEGGLDVVQLVGHWTGQIGLQNRLDLRKRFALIALRIPFFRPESDRNHLFILGLREEGQKLHESGLLLQNGKHFVPDYFYKLFFLFQLRDEFNNTGKHGNSPLRLRLMRGPEAAPSFYVEYLASQYHRHDIRPGTVG